VLTLAAQLQQLAGFSVSHGLASFIWREKVCGEQVPRLGFGGNSRVRRLVV
jgi:hypothetical protein